VGLKELSLGVFQWWAWDYLD